MAEQRLVIFTRYPEPSKTKTRLIPALGPEGAADVQRRMTRHTLDSARELIKRCPLSVDVRFEGGSAEKMAECFGNDMSYRPQHSGDLGVRMERAFADAFDQGAERTVVIGTDCPDLTPGLILDALQRLAASDLVLGPAQDGGYYLIGLRKPNPRLFEGIPWGSEDVFKKTADRAAELSLNVSLLEMLADVDRPEDLSVWYRAERQPPTTQEPTLSVIIPTLNEAKYLPQTLQSLRRDDDVEVIVVDGGSSDGTREIADQAGHRVLLSAPCRALQMNVGAEKASGSILLFLHADTRLEPNFASAVRATLKIRGTVAGAFRLQIDAPGWLLRVIERAVDFRSRFLQMPYGDQGIFVAKQTFRAVGGFPVLPIMEDFELIKRLRRRGRIRIAPRSATTSGRRWQELGPLRTTWINQTTILGHCLGVSPNRLARWYADSRP